MVIVQVCVGSSCHLKGSFDIVEMLQSLVAKEHLEDKIELQGSFCTGRCNRIGVTVIVNGQTFIGVTKEGFSEFWKDKILKLVEAEGN